MKNLNQEMMFFVRMAKMQAQMSRRFDASLGGLGLSDFLILYHVSQAPGESMRRTELAEKMGLTASGITRLLAPMEKVGLIKREATEKDARVSAVALAKGGKEKLQEALQRTEELMEDWFTADARARLAEAAEVLEEITAKIA